MPADAKPLLSPEDQEMLDCHVAVNRSKPLSYLPIQTIERVLGMTTTEYTSIVVAAGNETLVLDPDHCCIKSGAVYAFNYVELKAVLDKHADTLVRHKWPNDPRDFVRAVAAEWLDEGSPIMPVIRRAFGDL